MVYIFLLTFSDGGDFSFQLSILLTSLEIILLNLLNEKAKPSKNPPFFIYKNNITIEHIKKT